jgi:transposase
MNPKHHSHKRYDEEFKRNAVELMESSGRPIAEIASDLGLPYKTLERWKAKYRRERTLPGKASSRPTDKEVDQLRRKLAHVERERDILKKALAICSRELDPKGDSD